MILGLDDDDREAVMAVHEFIGRCEALCRRQWTAANEWLLNVDTTPTLHDLNHLGEAGLHRDRREYASPDYWYVRKILAALSLVEADVFYDIGCGKGRILCLAAQHTVRRCIGVELDAALCVVAEENARRVRRRRAPIEVIQGDAALVDMGLGTVYFMFNPFGPETLTAVLRNLKASLYERPRRIRIVYYNAIHESVFEAAGWLRRFDSLDTWSGMKVSFWEGDPAGLPS